MGFEPTTFCWWGSHATAASLRYTKRRNPIISNCGAKVVIKLSFCCASLHTNAFLLVPRQFFGYYLRSDHSAYRGWYRFPSQVICCGGGRNTARKSLGFSIEAICFFGTSKRSFIWYIEITFLYPRRYPEDTPKIDMRRWSKEYWIFTLVFGIIYCLIFAVIQLVKHLANC